MASSEKKKGATGTNMTKTTRKATVPFEWSSADIEQISVAPPIAPVKYANTSLESIIERVNERKKEKTAREIQTKKRLAKLKTPKPVIPFDSLVGKIDLCEKVEALNSYFR